MRRNKMKAMLMWMAAIALLTACGSQKKATTIQAKNAAAETLCGRTVRYTIEKLIITNGDGSEKEDNTTGILTLNPAGRKMTTRVVDEEKEESAEMNTVGCTLTADMQSGEAVYEIVESRVRTNGDTVIERTDIKLEAVKSLVHFSFSAKNKPGGMKATASQWEVVNSSALA